MSMMIPHHSIQKARHRIAPVAGSSGFADADGSENRIEVVA
jgi:hypothetical protein